MDGWAIMNTRYLRAVLSISGLTLFIAALVIILDSTCAIAQTPPQPITGPIANADQALAQARYFDAVYAVRSRPIDAVDVESPYLTTRQTYADSRGTGSKFPDPKTANQQVWVVRFKGETTLKLPGVPDGQIYANVTYVFAAETGEIVGVTTD